jgi:hypothetical protein
MRKAYRNPNPGRSARPRLLGLTAHSTAFVNGDPAATFLSRGQEVDECPFAF